MINSATTCNTSARMIASDRNGLLAHPFLEKEAFFSPWNQRASNFFEADKEPFHFQSSIREFNGRIVAKLINLIGGRREKMRKLANRK